MTSSVQSTYHDTEWVLHLLEQVLFHGFKAFPAMFVEVALEQC